MSIGIFNLCPAAHFYLVISIIAIVTMRLNLFGTNQVFCLGTYNCDASISETSIVIWIKIVYVLFWTWVLNIVCRKISPEIAWMFALAPFVLFFFLLFAVLFLGMKSGFTTMEPLTLNKQPLIENITYTGTGVSTSTSTTDVTHLAKEPGSYVDSTSDYSSYQSGTTATPDTVLGKGIFSGISIPTSSTRLETQAPTGKSVDAVLAELSPYEKLIAETQLEVQKQNLEILKTCNDSTSNQMMEEIQKQNLDLLRTCKQNNELDGIATVAPSAVIS